MATRQLMAAADATDYLGVAAQTLANWRYVGRGPRYFRLGGLVKYARRDLDDWLDAQAVEPEPQPA